MAKTRRVWNDMIGQQKEVNGYVFTLVAINGRKVVVDVVGRQFAIERSTWDKGVFSRQLKEIQPKPSECIKQVVKKISKYFEDRKVIEGHRLVVIDVKKDKLLVQDEDTKATAWTTKATWKKGVCKKLLKDLAKNAQHEKHELSTYVFAHGYLRDALMNAKHYEYSENFSFERAKVDYMEFQNNYWNEELENVLNDEEMNSLTKEKLIEGIKNSWKKCLEDVERQWEWYYSMAKFANCHSLSDVKKMYRELCSKEHPDKGGDAMKFRAITKAYEEAKQREEEKMNKTKVNMADLFAEFGF